MRRSNHTYLIPILLLSVLLRVGVVLTLGDTAPPASDELSYATLAARLATGHGYSFPIGWYPFTPAGAPTAHWSFLYTAFVGAVYAGFGPHPLAARLIQAVLAGLLLPWLAYRLARRALIPPSPRKERGPGGEVPLLAALLSAIYAYFVLYAAMVQTEAFYICALLWSLERALALTEMLRRAAAEHDDAKEVAAQHGDRGKVLIRALGLGLSLGIATLLRQSILPWVVVLFAWLLWQAVRSPAGDRPQGQGGTIHAALNIKEHLRSSAFLSVICVPVILLACIAPFTIRNYRAYGDFLLLNSNAGYAMYSAQHPMHGTSFQEYAAAPLPADLLAQGLNEAQWDKALMRRGIGFVLADPGRYVMLSLSRVRDYFEFWPTADSSLLFNLGRVLSFGLFLPFMLYGVFLEIKAKVKGKGGYFSPSALTLTLAFAIFYSLLHIATWAMSRYRLPVDAVLLLFAAAGIADPARRIRRARLVRQCIGPHKRPFNIPHSIFHIPHENSLPDPGPALSPGCRPQGAGVSHAAASRRPARSDAGLVRAAR